MAYSLSFTSTVCSMADEEEQGGVGDMMKQGRTRKPTKKALEEE